MPAGQRLRGGHRDVGRGVVERGRIPGEDLKLHMAVTINGIGIERVLAGVEHDEGVHFETEIDEAARLALDDTPEKPL